MRGLAFALCLAALPAAGVAQDEEPAQQEAFRMVDAYIVSHMQESLGLDDAQFARMIPLVKSLQATRREMTQRRRHSLMRLRRELGTGRASEAVVVELVGSLRTLRTEEARALDAAYAAIDAELDPIQQGRFRIMEIEVERRIRELLQRARRGDARPR